MQVENGLHDYEQQVESVQLWIDSWKETSPFNFGYKFNAVMVGIMNDMLLNGK